jgi:hypothetical protein
LQDFFFEDVFVDILGSLVSFIFVLMESGTGYPFSSFPENPVLNYFGGENGFHPLFFFLSLFLRTLFMIG